LRADRYSPPERASEQIPVRDRQQTLDDGHPPGVAADQDPRFTVFDAANNHFAGDRWRQPQERLGPLASLRDVFCGQALRHPRVVRDRGGDATGVDYGHADVGAREFVAERFHSAEDYLRKLNRPMNLDELKPGDTVKVPNVLPFKIEDLHAGFAEPNPAFANRIVYIDTKERFLLIYDNGQLVAEFPITPGSTKLPAPIGVWKIVGIATLPVFRHDEGILNYGIKSDTAFILPAGPNNPVGILWMGLSKPHVGIHGTNQPETIGRAASHGCIRTANWDAARVKELVTVGNVVSIF